MRHLLRKLPSTIPEALVLNKQGNFKLIEEIFNDMQTFFDEEFAGKGSWRLKCGRCGRMIETADDWGGMDNLGKTICVDCLYDDLLDIFSFFISGGEENEKNIKIPY